MKRGTRFLVGVLMAGFGGTARGQELDPRAQPSLVWPVAGGVGGGALGLVLGGLAGRALSTNCRGEDCGLVPVLSGLAIGEVAGIALGVHLGNKRRGSIALDLLGSAGFGLAGAWVASRSTRTGWGGVAAVGAAQVGGTVLLERAVGGVRARRARVEAFFGPRSGGDGRLGLGLRF